MSNSSFIDKGQRGKLSGLKAKPPGSLHLLCQLGQMIPCVPHRSIPALGKVAKEGTGKEQKLFHPS